MKISSRGDVAAIIRLLCYLDRPALHANAKRMTSVCHRSRLQIDLEGRDTSTEI